MVLDPVVNFLQGHVSVLLAVDSKLDHSHVGIRGSLWQRVLLLFWSFGLLKRKQTQFLRMKFKKQNIEETYKKKKNFINQFLKLQWNWSSDRSFPPYCGINPSAMDYWKRKIYGRGLVLLMCSRLDVDMWVWHSKMGKLIGPNDLRSPVQSFSLEDPVMTF